MPTWALRARTNYRLGTGVTAAVRSRVKRVRSGISSRVNQPRVALVTGRTPDH